MTGRRGTSAKLRGRSRNRPVEFVHQFLVVLANTEPLIWRRFQVPEAYSLWDLHVAIQDAMGWEDSHLHEFNILHPASGRPQRLGIPHPDEPAERSLHPDWRALTTEYFTPGNPLALYVYDFGDDWRHVVVYEGTSPAVSSLAYPRCLGGARACPPEDSGGPHRYAELLAALANPTHPERADFLAWAGDDFDPGAFNLAGVAFDDPEQRWKSSFEGDQNK